MQGFSPPRPPTTASRDAPPSSHAHAYYPAAVPEEQSQVNGAARRDSSPPARRTSFGFLRSRSTERKVSGGKMRKQKAREKEEQLRREREAATAIAPKPPTLPKFAPLPVMNTFGGDRPDSIAIISNQASNHQPSNMYASSPPATVPIPPVPTTPSQGYVDPYARTESMTHRSRYSYASSAVSTFNSPRRVRRRKDPTPFNIMVIGSKNCGKTSFINFLRSSLASKKTRPGDSSPPPTSSPGDASFTSHYLETEIDGERLGLTIWDSVGLEKGIVDLQVRGMSAFIESKFEDTFLEEQKVMRAPGVRDTHIHCVFLVLDPVRLDANVQSARQSVRGVPNAKPSAPSRLLSGLDDNLDLHVLRSLQGKTTVIPVISKADTITTAHMSYLKRTVWDSLKQAKLDPLEALDLDDSDEDGTLDEEDEEDFQAVSKARSEQDTPIDNILDRSSSEGESSYPSPHDEATPLKHTVTTSSPKPAEKKSHRRSTSSISAALSPSSPNSSSSSSEPPYLPLSIISPDIYDPDTPGRRFPWGVADPFNSSHCDFVRLRDSVFTAWRSELRDVARDKWYEGWRTARLNRRTKTGSGTPARMTRRVSAGTDAARPPVGAGGGAEMLSAGGPSPGEIGVAATTAGGAAEMGTGSARIASPYGKAGGAGGYR
ncbi:MAG: hypothetical protein M1821_005213 [Bathelium mastoideum]|nr:MAG: hypothetical protein M1821_005213 [Bathelium mastoideum]